MKQMGVQFGDKQLLQVDDLSVASGFGKSTIARAAMQLGLMAIRDADTATRRDEIIAISNLKALN